MINKKVVWALLWIVEINFCSSVLPDTLINESDLLELRWHTRDLFTADEFFTFFEEVIGPILEEKIYG